MPNLIMKISLSLLFVSFICKYQTSFVIKTQHVYEVKHFLCVVHDLCRRSANFCLTLMLEHDLEGSLILNRDIPEEPEESQKIRFTVSHTSA